MTHHWLTASEAAAHLQISVRTFRREVARGRYPPGFNVSAGRVRWRAADLDAALDPSLGVPEHHAPDPDPIMAALLDACQQRPPPLRGARARQGA